MKRKKPSWKGLVGLIVTALILAGCGGSGDYSTSGADTSGEGTGISNIFSSPAEMGVGDIMPIEFGDSTEVSVDFSGVESGANFILAVGSYNATGGGTSMQLSATDVSLPEASALTAGMMANSEVGGLEDDGYGPSEILSAWLRASESELQYIEDFAEEDSPDLSKAMKVKALAVGETETFRVLSSLTSTTSYVEVTGEVACVGSNVVFYVDTAVPESILSSDDVNELCGNFDTIAGEEQDLLGDTSDVDGDGKTHVLMTKEINELGALGGGIITGYFYAGDLYSRSVSNPVSNEREIIYTMVPDPNGIYGTAVSNGFAMTNLLPAVLPHELQHAISYNQHVNVYGGTAEENWLNEAMSHFIEDYMGYNVENPSRYAMFLSSPSTYGVVTQSSPNLMERGASYLFLRFLYERADDGAAFLRSLVQTSDTGVENLVQAFAGPSDMDAFSEMFARWVIALIMTDRGVSQDSRYIYRARVRHSRTNNWEGVCLDCEAEDNRGTELTGVNLNPYYGYHTAAVDASAASFFQITTLPNEMTLKGTSGGGNFGILVRTK